MRYAEGGEGGPFGGREGGDVGGAEEDGGAEGAGGCGEREEGWVAEVVYVWDYVEEWGGEGGGGVGG